MLSRVSLVVLLFLSPLSTGLASGTSLHFEIMEGSWYGDGPADPLQVWTFTALSESGNVLQSQGTTITPIRLGETTSVTGYPLWQSFTLDGLTYEPCQIECPDNHVALFFDPANGNGALTGAGCLTAGPCVTFHGVGEATIELYGPNYVGNIVFVDPPFGEVVHAPEPATAWFVLVGLAMLALMKMWQTTIRHTPLALWPKHYCHSSILRQENH